MLVVDLSSNNRAPDWHALKRAGVGGVWLKATEGLTWRDPDFHQWRVAANSVGLHVGAYHFARPDMHPYEAVAEAKNFVSAVKTVGVTDLRPVLDFETRSSHGNDEN